MKRQILISLCWMLVLAVMAGADPALAQDDGQGDGGAVPQTSEPSAKDLSAEGMEKLLQALGVLIKRIPQYELPEVQDNGDILIRRIHKPAASEQ